MNPFELKGGEYKEYVDYLRLRKTQYLECQSRAGEPNPPTWTREALMLHFVMDSAMTKMGMTPVGPAKPADAQVLFTLAEYPPCVTPLAELKKIMTTDLRLGIHHRGAYLLIRPVTPMLRKGHYMMVIVEDEKGGVCQLRFFSSERDHELNHEDGPGMYSAFILKEPYLEIVSPTDQILRLDHPSDALNITFEDESLPIAWKRQTGEADTSPTHWKQMGNDCFKADKLLLAIKQ